jgi:hypothetical protein
MKRFIIYGLAAVALVFFLAVAHYSIKEVIYNFSGNKPVPVSAKPSEQVGKFVSIKGKVFGSRVARVSHQGIEMYFYPVEGHANKLYVVTDGEQLPGEMIMGKTLMTGELKELSRIPFARSAYKDLGLKDQSGAIYYAIKVGKTPNPSLVYTYGISLLLIAVFMIPVFYEIKLMRKKSSAPVSMCA